MDSDAHGIIIPEERKSSIQVLEASSNSSSRNTKSAENRYSGNPEPLDEKSENEYALPISIFGLNVITSVLSPYFGNRETGLKALIEQLPCKLDQPELVVKAAFQMINYVSSDIREKSNTLYCELYRITLEFAVAKSISGTMILPLIATTFPSLLNKAGDSNPRIKEVLYQTEFRALQT